MSKIGPKEQAQRDLQEKKLSRAHEMMLEDGCPPKCLRTGSAPKIKPRSQPDPGVTLAPPLAVQKAIAAEFAETETETTNAPAPPVADQQENDMAKKKRATKKTVKPKAKPKMKAAVKSSEPRKGVSPLDVANFMCREGGTSMDDLVKKFGIDAHPMRTKIFIARHKLGYQVERRDGRFFSTAPR